TSTLLRLTRFHGQGPSQRPLQSSSRSPSKFTRALLKVSFSPPLPLLASAVSLLTKEVYMDRKSSKRQKRLSGTALAVLALSQVAAPPVTVAEVQPKTPIQHVIIIIGENRTFDHIFATYQPRKGETVDNLLSKGIINADGTPGPNFSLALQST